MAQIRDIARITKLRAPTEKKKKEKQGGGGSRVQLASDEAPVVGVRIPLTVEQLAVVNLPPDARALVTAGPGTGKTHVLIARLAALVQRHGLQPGRELLVLSFSRAAVGEIRRRVVAAGGDVRYTRTYTFDSFATRLLTQVDPGGTWQEESYDGRIRRAAAEIEKNPEAREVISGYAHVLVDEIQDLVGVRADLVLKLLEASSGGFTLLGDPAQGIYNFQLQNKEERRLGSQTLYNRLRRQYGTGLLSHSLTENHRVLTQAAGLALRTGSKLNGATPDYSAIARELEEIVEKLPRLSDPPNNLLRLLVKDQATAILCRTNAQALVISRDLFRAGIGHSYRRSATDRIVHPWIGTVFGFWNSAQIGKTAFLRLLREKVEDYVPDPEEAWRLLKQIEGQTGNTLDIAAVAARVMSGTVPDELNLVDSHPLTISTIHRAKGLEFDRVFVVEPEAWRADPADLLELAEEARLLYVALTRPKRELLRMPAPDTRGIKQLGDDARWVKRSYRWKLEATEIKGQDIHSRDPAGGYLLKNVNVADTQDYLRHEVKPGDPVTVRRASENDQGRPRAFYSVEHNGRSIGITSENFSDVLYSIIRVNQYWQVQWPTVFEGVRVEAVDTVAGTVAAAQNADLNSTGLWLRVRVSGFARPRW